MKKIALVAVALVLSLGVTYQLKKTLKWGEDSSNPTHASNSNTLNPDGSAANPSGDPAHPVLGPDGKPLAVNPVGANGSPNGTHAANANSGTVDATHPGTSVANGTGGTSAVNQSLTNGKNGSAPGAAGASGSLGASVNGSGNAASGSAGSEVAKPVAVVPEKPKDDCFAFEYRHKKEAKSRDIEEFLDLTNASFPLLHPNYNADTLCVKVNDKAVNFTMAKVKGTSEVRVGSVVGPESVIRVSYCVGKVTCKESCDTPKKRFMDDLMADSGDEDSFNDSWGKGENDAHKKDLKEKAKQLRAVASESQNLNEGSVVRTWETLQKQEWVCKDSAKRKGTK